MKKVWYNTKRDPKLRGVTTDQERRIEKGIAPADGVGRPGRGSTPRLRGAIARINGVDIYE